MTHYPPFYVFSGNDVNIRNSFIRNATSTCESLYIIPSSAIWGQPSRGGSKYQGRGKKLGKRDFRGSEGTAKNFEHFVGIFWKFVNKMQLKVIFGVVLVYISRKFRKIPVFGRKIHLPTAKNWRYIYQGGVTPHEITLIPSAPNKSSFPSSMLTKNETRNKKK